MFKRNNSWLAFIMGLAILSGAPHASAQKEDAAQKASPSESASRSQAAEKPAEQFRVDLAINELEDGKKINSRQYSINLATNEGNEINIGTRVPVEAKEGDFQYMDVGTSIMARLNEVRGQTELTVRATISSFAMTESPLERQEMRPIVRQIKMGGTVLLPVAKPFVIGSADDPNSRREFQLEVTVTKVR
jgi:hypothetical protein